MDREAQQLVALMRSGWLRLGRLICKIIDTHAYEALGFPSMKTWIDARLGESASSAFSALRSVRALVGVAEENLTFSSAGQKLRPSLTSAAIAVSSLPGLF
jgi:hypothetical protein